MNFLCSFGRHRPRGIPRWNDGFYFATCARCGCDLVRTAFEGWHVPSGYKVVWSDRPPASRPDVALISTENGAPAEAPADFAQTLDPAPAPAVFVPEPLADSPAELSGEMPGAPTETEAVDEEVSAEPAPAPAGPVNGRLPIQDVLAQLNAEDAANRIRETPQPAPAEPPARRRAPAWDFMDDDPSRGDAAHFVPSGRIPPPPGTPPFAGPETEYADARSRRAGGLPERWRTFRSAVRNFWSGPAEPNPPLVIGLALAVAVAAAALLALYAGNPSSPGPAEPSIPVRGAERAQVEEGANPFAADAPDISRSKAEGDRAAEAVAGSVAPPGDRAWVAASLLVCRSAPRLQADRVRNLVRGKEVRVMSIEGEWASLAYRGGQCWAHARFISPVPPLEGN